MASLKREEFLNNLENTYGKIISISNIQLSHGQYDITCDTEKRGTVYFSTGGGFDDYKYSPVSKSWSEHVYGGLTLDRFRNVPFVFGKSKDDGYPKNNWIKSLRKKYGKVLSIRVTDHWKYKVEGEITVEKRDRPVKVLLCRELGGYCDIDTYNVSWSSVFSGDSTDVYETDSDDEKEEEVVEEVVAEET